MWPELEVTWAFLCNKKFIKMKIVMKKVVELYNQGVYDLTVASQLLGISVLYFIESLFEYDLSEDWTLTKKSDWIAW